MASSNVFNKILISSLAFGVSFGVGMLISDKNINQSLVTGGLAGTAGLIGASVARTKKEELPEGINSLEELKAKETELQKSLSDKN